MANKSLDGFLGKEERRLVDLDWLDIDPSDYKNMPFDDTPEYISEPKLINLWDHSDDRSSFDLVPNVDTNFNYKNEDVNKLKNDRMTDVRKLFDFVKAEMMSGKTGKELEASIKERSTPEVIKLAFNALEKLSKEQGLLGKVYIDPTIFTKCDQGASFVAKRAKTAKYVLAMDKCGGCAFNKAGRCEVYKKILATDIKYDQKLFDFYSKHLSNVTGKDIRIASKNELKQAFLVKEDTKVKTAEFKPKITESSEKTLEQKQKDFDNQFQDLQKTLSDVKTSKIAKDLGMMLVKGYNAKTIKDYVSNKYSSSELEQNKKILNSVLDKQGSLGKVYVDASLIPYDLSSDKEAREFFSNYAKDVKYVLANCSCAQCVCKTFNKIIVSDLKEIPQEEWDKSFDKYSKNLKDKISSVYLNNPSKGLRLAYLQEDLSKKNLDAPKKVESYDLSNKLDTNEYKFESEKEVYFTPKNISAALRRGYTLSSIFKTGSSLGFEDNYLIDNIKRSFEGLVSEVNRYQLDLPNIEVPKTVKIKSSNKDISIDMGKKLSNFHEISYDSSNAPIDDLVNDLGLKSADLDTSKISSEKSDLEVSGLDQFTID